MNTQSSIWNAVASTAFAVKYLHVGGWRTRVLEAGSGEPLVLLHGSGGHLEAYMHNIAALAEHFHVIAYDMPGHGYSQEAVEPLEMDTYVEHLRQLITQLGLGRVNLNGESLGGWVSMKFAATHPELVRRLVLNTPGGTMANPQVMQRIRELSQAAADEPTDERIRARLEWLMADPATVTDELVESRQRIYAQPYFPTSMQQIMVLQDPNVRQRNMVTDEDLQRITAPALVIWTSDDPSGPASAGRSLAEALPNGRFEHIDRAGHWPQWEQNAQFNSIVIDFLKEPGA